jgi:hypothetical protein
MEIFIIVALIAIVGALTRNNELLVANMQNDPDRKFKDEWDWKYLKSEAETYKDTTAPTLDLGQSPSEKLQ